MPGVQTAKTGKTRALSRLFLPFRIRYLHFVVCVGFKPRLRIADSEAFPIKASNNWEVVWR
jgi:hypothetical protein